MEDSQEVTYPRPSNRVIRYVSVGIRYGFPNLQHDFVSTIGQNDARFGVWSGFGHLLSGVAQRQHSFGGSCKKGMSYWGYPKFELMTYWRWWRAKGTRAEGNVG